MRASQPQRAVFFDRDGVLNEVVFRDNRPGSPRSLDEFRLYQNLGDPLARLSGAGFKLFVVTNQPDVTRHLLSDQTLLACNRMIQGAFPIQRIKVCIHDDNDGCTCRKPRPGMLIELASTEQIDLSSSYVVGDTWKDSLAARAAGCISVILDRTYNGGDPADFRVPDVAAAADLILGLKMQ